MSKKKIVPALILLGGLLISVGILISANLASAQSVGNSQVSQWTDATGLGISVPACSSASPTVTCVNNTPQATLSWIYGDRHGTCNYSTVTITGVESVARECTGTRNLNNLANNTTYNYNIAWSTSLPEGDSYTGSFTTPNCAGPTNTTLNVESRTASNVSIARIGGPSNIGGTTNYTRTYSTSVSAVLRAPATAGGTNFSAWLGCDSVGGTGNRDCTVNINSGGTQTVTADYDSGPPTTPVLESVTTSCSAGDPRNTVSWSASETASITEYHIERCSGSSCTNFAQIATDNSSPYVDTNVIQNTLYRYRVRSHNHNTSLFSSYSNTIGRTTADCTVPPPTVSVVLTANKTSGSAPFNNVALTGTVSGTATGPMTYTFYCDSTDTSTNVVAGWTAQYSNINANPRTTNDAHRCDYPIAGTYRAKVIVEREGVFAQDRQTITVSSAPGPDLTAGVTSPGTATAGLPVTLSASVSNIGTASTGAGFTNLFQRATSAGGANATDIGTHVRGSALGTSNSINATLSYTFPSAGDYYVRVCADKSAAINNGVIAELNENNNCGPWSSITVGTGPGSFNYSLSNSGNVSVTKGSGNVFGQNTITKTLTASPTQSVTLSLSGVPNGTTYSISNSSCSPTCTSVITFTVSPSTNVGTYPITVTGSPLNKQTNFNLVISGSPMSVSCSANKGTALVGETVTWTATVSGGTQPLSYSWSGTSIPTNPAPSTNPFSIAYSTIGMKNTTVTVTDNASLQATCLSTIQVSFDPEFEEF